MCHEIRIQLFTELLAHTLIHGRVHLDRQGHRSLVGEEGGQRQQDWTHLLVGDWFVRPGRVGQHLVDRIF